MTDNLSHYLISYRDYIHPKGVAKVLTRHQKSWPYVWAHIEHFRDDYLIESDGDTFTALEWEKQRKAGLISYERAQHGGLTMLGKWVEMGSLIETFRNEWFLTFSLHLFDENRALIAKIAQCDQGSDYRCYTAQQFEGVEACLFRTYDRVAIGKEPQRPQEIALKILTPPYNSVEIVAPNRVNEVPGIKTAYFGLEADHSPEHWGSFYARYEVDASPKLLLNGERRVIAEAITIDDQVRISCF